jgi:23S rRNA (cytidine1920-2'-O)/16S rRNA (cytidine1409-2'-O)-methyltransferase
MAGMRLDQRVVQLGLVESREKAQRLILAGCVKVNDRVETKSSHSVPEDAVVALVEQERFVGRGGEKMEEAFLRFGLDVKGKVCMDVGASTGGFTDCLLQHGAARVYALDVGKGQIHSKLSSDPRVVVMDGVNARYLAAADLPEVPDFVTIDVAFISLTKVLPAVTQVLANGGRIVSLIKPQFEAGREQVGKGGVVRSEAVRDEVVERVRLFGTGELGLKWLGVCPSPIKGPAGNVEFLAYWEKVGK